MRGDTGNNLFLAADDTSSEYLFGGEGFDVAQLPTSIANIDSFFFWPDLDKGVINSSDYNGEWSTFIDGIEAVEFSDTTFNLDELYGNLPRKQIPNNVTEGSYSTFKETLVSTEDYAAFRAN